MQAYFLQNRAIFTNDHREAASLRTSHKSTAFKTNLRSEAPKSGTGTRATDPGRTIGQRASRHQHRTCCTISGNTAALQCVSQSLLTGIQSKMFLNTCDHPLEIVFSQMAEPLPFRLGDRFYADKVLETDRFTRSIFFNLDPH